MGEGKVFNDGVPVTTPSTDVVSALYAVRSDLEQIFGISNIVKWSILSGAIPTSDTGQLEINNRINWAISLSSAEYRNAMRQGGYQMPLDGPDAIVWQTNLVAIKAGLYLYMHLRPTQRGEDGRPIRSEWDGLFTYVEQQLSFIRARKLRLDGTPFGKGTSGPFVTHSPNWNHLDGPGQTGYGPPCLPTNFPYGG